MTKTAKNLIVILGIITVVFAGYYLFTQDSNMFLRSSSSEQQLQQLVASSQLFLERSTTLQQIAIDTSVFDSNIFNSLKSYSPAPDQFEFGRENPFAAPGTANPISANTVDADLDQ